MHSHTCASMHAQSNVPQESSKALARAPFYRQEWGQRNATVTNTEHQNTPCPLAIYSRLLGNSATYTLLAACQAALPVHCLFKACTFHLWISSHKPVRIVYSKPILALMHPAPSLTEVPCVCQPLQGNSRKETYATSLYALHTVPQLASLASCAAAPAAVLGRRLRTGGRRRTELT